MKKMEDMDKQILEKAEQDDVKFIQLQFTDLQGMIKAVTIPVEKLEEIGRASCRERV